MDTEARNTKAGDIGRRVAMTLKRVMAAERRLISRSGHHQRLVRGGLIAIKLVLAIGLAVVSLWALAVVLPLALLMLVVAFGHDGERCCTGKSMYSDGHGLRDGPQGYGWYRYGVKADPDDY